jgi:adenosine kinase
MLGYQGNCAVLGSVGNDYYGDLYFSVLEKENILPLWERFDNVNTGVTCVFCSEMERGHLTDLGASTLISIEYVKRHYNLLKETEMIYVDLFIFKHRREIVYLLADLGTVCDERLFGFNLPSLFFIEAYFDDIKDLLQYADFIFCNYDESIYLGKLLGLDIVIFVLIKDNINIGNLCKQLAKFKKRNLNKRRIVCITHGPKPAYIAEYDFIAEEITYFGAFPPKFVEESLVVDTNGAGDAFAGGFLSQLVKSKSLDCCMKAGHWAASMIIQSRGCQIPADTDYYTFN